MKSIKGIVRIIYIVILLEIICCCEKKETVVPIPSFSISPSFGDQSTVFLFDAHKTFDLSNGIESLKFRWDIFNDSIWDSELSSLSKFPFRIGKYGTHAIRLEVVDKYGNVSSLVNYIDVEPIIKDSIIIDSRDGEVYRVCLINGLWWMAEDLRYGEKLTIDQQPHDNGLVEKFVIDTTVQGVKQSFTYYTHSEISHYQRNPIKGICPRGWKLPNFEEGLIFRDYFQGVSNIRNLLGPSGFFGFNVRLNGVIYPNESLGINTVGSYWLGKSTSNDRPEEFYWFFFLNDYSIVLYRSENVRYESHYIPENFAMSLRCVKSDE